MEFIYPNTCQISKTEIQGAANKLVAYTQYLQQVAAEDDYSRDESSINLPFDNELKQKVIELKKRKADTNLKYIIDIGIGGSNLGARAVYDALFGYFDLIEPNRFPKIIFADTNDPGFLARLRDFLEEEIAEPSEVLANVVSKSGTTAETIVNLEILEECIPGAQKRLVVTTGPQSKLAQTADQRGISRLSIPDKVGGRFSVLSAAGLFPLAALGINIEELLAGARGLRDKCLAKDIFQNPAALSAIIIYLNFKQGKIINNNFFFHPELESTGKWYRQLMGESIGKEKDRAGNIVNTGITPTVSIGSTDLHSTAQLFLGGPKDKFTTFVWAKRQNSLAKVPAPPPFPNILTGLQGKSAADIMLAIYEGVKIAYQKAQLPFAEVILPNISPYSLGQFLQFKMIEMLYLGKLFNVNTFNQPAVETYKQETLRILQKKRF